MTARLDELRLPVYRGDVPRTYKVHISHVLKRLTYLAMKESNPSFNPYGIESSHLKNSKRQWEIQYPDLAK